MTMIAGMARRLSSPEFIGRAAELDLLLSSAAQAETGVPGVALVGGEAGVGKSRLVAEAGGRLRDRGWLVVEGGSVALGDDGLPFGPIVEALRTLVRQIGPDAVTEAAGPSLAELARLVPELPAPAGSATAPIDRAEWLQIRIFEGVLGLLGRLSAQQPLALVVEDLHWADRSTRDLLAFLARNAREERLLVVATFRMDELHRRHPLRAWLGEAERLPRVERLDLKRFEPDEIRALLTAILGAPPTPTLLESVVRRSEGNAFFAEELAAASDPDGAARLPDTLREVLLARHAGASEQALRLVEVAAVAGRQVDHAILARVCGLDEPQLMDAVREAVASQLLVATDEGPNERYAFRHALLQEAVYETLLPSDRRRLHAAYARALEALPTRDGSAYADASRLVEIAHHWNAAHEPANALAAAIVAGEAARAAFAFAEAGHEFERAIEKWEAVPPEARPAGYDLGALYLAAAEATMLAGDAVRAVTLARKATLLFDERDADQDPSHRARAREILGRAAWMSGDTDASIDVLREAVGLLEGQPVSTVHGRVLAGLAANLMLAGREREAAGIALRAIQLAEKLGADDVRAHASVTLGVCEATFGDLDTAITRLRDATALAERIREPTAVGRGYACLGTVLEMAGELDASIEISLAGVEANRRLGAASTFGAFIANNAAATLIEQGRLAEARDVLNGTAGFLTPGVSTIHHDLTLARLEAAAGNMAAALAMIDAVDRGRVGMRDAQFSAPIRTTEAIVALWSGRPADAIDAARAGFDVVDGTDDPTEAGALAAALARAGADLAQAGRAARDAAAEAHGLAAAEDALARLEVAAARYDRASAAMRRELGWRRQHVAAELGRATGADDPATWAAARVASAHRRSGLLEAYLLWREAEAHAAGGDLAAARDAVVEGHRIAAGTGARPQLDALAGLARRLRADLADTTPTSPAGPPAADGSVQPDEASAEGAAHARAERDPFGLTPREREVLVLLAAGYTNRRIAATLFVSESTAGVHVSNILGKLGVASRTEAATVAVRLGLDRAPGLDPSNAAEEVAAVSPRPR